MTGNTGGAGVLLPSVDPVRKSIVGDDVVELPGRLVVPGAPGAATIDGDDRPLIDAEDSAVGGLRVDPERVVVVAARCPLHRHKCLAAILGAIDVDVAGVDDVRIFRLDGDAAEIPAA